MHTYIHSSSTSILTYIYTLAWHLYMYRTLVCHIYGKRTALDATAREGIQANEPSIRVARVVDRLPLLRLLFLRKKKYTYQYEDTHIYSSMSQVCGSRKSG